MAFFRRRVSLGFASLRAVFYVIPNLRPFLAPRERAPTSEAGLLRQVCFAAHLGHGNDTRVEPALGTA